MKRKWTPHIIAVVALAVFVVLGLASAASTPGTPQSNQATDGNGGVIVVTSVSDAAYIFIIPEHSKGIFNLWNRGDVNNIRVKNDGSYTIRYQTKPDGKTPLPDEPGAYLFSKTVYVSGGERVEVSIP